MPVFGETQTGKSQAMLRLGLREVAVRLQAFAWPVRGRRDEERHIQLHNLRDHSCAQRGCQGRRHQRDHKHVCACGKSP